MRGVVVLGGLNMDLIVETPQAAGPGETREGTKFSTTPGGKGGNQAVAAARILDSRAPVGLVARVGDDAFGDELRAQLAGAGVDVRHVREDVGADSGVAVIFIDPVGENSVDAVYGANARCDDQQASDALTALADASVLLVQQEITPDVTLEVMHAARDGGATVILDPAPTREVLPDGFLAAADVLTPNEHEAGDLCGFAVIDAGSARAAARQLRAAGPSTVIVTLAEAGVWVEAEGISELVAAPAVDAVATVGAGDAFNGGLAAALAQGLDLRVAVRVGVATGALCVTKPGAQAAMPERADVDALLAEDW
ncbi:MAG TPA: ribokinase [Dehalococcoidia bacterium]|nr:ribokinase [Dehalococcoidia bacterium]